MDTFPSPVPLDEDYVNVTDLNENEEWSVDDVLGLSEDGLSKFGSYVDLGPGFGGFEIAPNAYEPPSPPKEEPWVQPAAPAAVGPVNVETLFTDSELRNSEPDEWALLRDRRTKGLQLSDAQLRMIAKLRRRKRGCVHAATQRVRRAERSTSMKDKLAKAHEELRASRAENAGLRKELAELTEMIAIFGGGKTA